MEILVLGPGCANCVKLYETIKKVVEETGIDATVRKIDDIMELVKWGIASAPAIVVDGEVKAKGYIPSESEILEIIRN